MEGVTGERGGAGGGGGAHSSSSDGETSKATSPGKGSSEQQHGHHPYKRKRRNWTDDELARLRSAIQLYGNNLELIRKNFNLEERQPRVLRRKIHELQAKMKQEKKGSVPKGLTNEDDESDEPRYDYEMQLTFETHANHNNSQQSNNSGDDDDMGSSSSSSNAIRSTQPFAPWMIIDKGVLNLVWQELPQRSYSVSFAISSECIYMTAEVTPPSSAQLSFLNLSEPSPQLLKTSFVGKYIFPPEITVWPNTLSVSHHAGLFVVRATINNPQKRFELSVPPVEPTSSMMDEIQGLVDSSATASALSSSSSSLTNSATAPPPATTTTTAPSLSVATSSSQDATSTSTNTTSTTTNNPHHLSTLGSAAVVASLTSSTPK